MRHLFSAALAAFLLAAPSFADSAAPTTIERPPVATQKPAAPIPKPTYEQLEKQVAQDAVTIADLRVSLVQLQAVAAFSQVQQEKVAAQKHLDDLAAKK